MTIARRPAHDLQAPSPDSGDLVLEDRRLVLTSLRLCLPLLHCRRLTQAGPSPPLLPLSPSRRVRPVRERPPGLVPRPPPPSRLPLLHSRRSTQAGPSPPLLPLSPSRRVRLEWERRLHNGGLVQLQSPHLPLSPSRRVRLVWERRFHSGLVQHQPPPPPLTLPLLQSRRLQRPQEPGRDEEETCVPCSTTPTSMALVRAGRSCRRQPRRRMSSRSRTRGFVLRPGRSSPGEPGGRPTRPTSSTTTTTAQVAFYLSRRPCDNASCFGGRSNATASSR